MVLCCVVLCGVRREVRGESGEVVRWVGGIHTGGCAAIIPARCVNTTPRSTCTNCSVVSTLQH